MSRPTSKLGDAVKPDAAQPKQDTGMFYLLAYVPGQRRHAAQLETDSKDFADTWRTQHEMLGQLVLGENESLPVDWAEKRAGDVINYRPPAPDSRVVGAPDFRGAQDDGAGGEAGSPASTS